MEHNDVSEKIEDKKLMNFKTKMETRQLFDVGEVENRDEDNWFK